MDFIVFCKSLSLTLIALLVTGFAALTVVCFSGGQVVLGIFGLVLIPLTCYVGRKVALGFNDFIARYQ